MVEILQSEELVNSGDYLKASKLFNDHKDYFLGKDRSKECYGSFSKIISGLNNKYQNYSLILRLEVNTISILEIIFSKYLNM